MNKQAYKLAFDKMEPEAGMRERLEARVAQQRTISARPAGGHRRSRTLAAAVAGSVVIAASVGVFVYLQPKNSPDSLNPLPTAGVGGDRADGSVYLPKMELPKQSNAAMMDMIGLIVYQGRIYTQTSSRVAPEAAKDVLGEKIGRSIGNISEWSSQDEFAKEFASTIGEQDVYTVKGYDRDFRLMTYFVDEDGRVWSEFYECLNGIRLANGADLFQKLRIEGQIQTANLMAKACMITPATITENLCC